ncbi:unnamed protein product [Calypogeia fissa]
MHQDGERAGHSLGRGEANDKQAADREGGRAGHAKQHMNRAGGWSGSRLRGRVGQGPRAGRENGKERKMGPAEEKREMPTYTVRL